MTTSRYEVLGTAVTVTAPRALSNYLNRLLGPFVVPGVAAVGVDFRIEKESSSGYTLLGESGEALGRDKAMAVVNRLLTEINRTVIARLAVPGFHAGVVGIGRDVLAFPAASGTGKSTLTAACALAGFGYWSDEALVCDPNGAIVPYPRPVMLSPLSRRLLGLDESQPSELAYAPAGLGVDVGAGPGRLAHLIELRRRPGPADLAKLSAAAAVTLLLQNSFNHYRFPELTFQLVTGFANDATTYTLSYEDPVEAASLLKKEFGSSGNYGAVPPKSDRMTPQ